MAKRCIKDQDAGSARTPGGVPEPAGARVGYTLRFAISSATAATLFDSPFIRRIAIDQREVPETATYYDTAGAALQKDGLLFALGRNAAGCFRLLEHASSHPEAGIAPPFPTLPVDGHAPDVAVLSELAAPLCPSLAPGDLKPLLAIRLTRHRLLVKWRGRLARITFDRGDYLTPEQKVLAPLSEIVLQQSTGPAEDFFDLALALTDHVRWRQVGLPRGEIGFSLLASPLAPRRRKARQPEIGRKESARAAFKKVMGESLAQFFANDPAVIRDTAEAVHQSRVAIRRLRAALRAFKPALPAGERKGFNAEFRWLQQQLGESRDWHVFQTETLPAIAALGDDQRSVLFHLAHRAQARGLQAALEALASRRAARLLLRVQQWLHRLDEAGPALDQPVKELAAKLVRNGYGGLRAAGPLNARRPMAEIHAIRIRGKQLRYALEFFASLKALAPFVPALPALNALQTQLGNANDAAVALRLLSAKANEPVSAASRRAVEAWAAARIVDCIDEAKPAMARIHELFGR